MKQRPVMTFLGGEIPVELHETLKRYADRDARPMRYFMEVFIKEALERRNVEIVRDRELKERQE